MYNLWEQLLLYFSGGGPNTFPKTIQQQLTKEEVEELLQARRAQIATGVDHNTQTARGKLFEMLADLTDDDGAISEMEDLGDLWDDLADGLE